MTKRYFLGHEVSDYGVQNGRVDFRCLAQCFDSVMHNSILNVCTDGIWAEVNGSLYDEETEDYTEVFQKYIVSEDGVEVLKKYTDEVVVYNSVYDMYVWCVTHYGTPWDYVLTNIEIEK